MQPGAVLCMFTDGLVERRYEPIDDGINRLCQVVTPGPPEGVCVSVMHDLVGRQYPRDDIALLILGRGSELLITSMMSRQATQRDDAGTRQYRVPASRRDGAG